MLQHVRATTASPEAAATIRAELSEREIEVLKLIANGKDNAMIAGELHISPKTVKNHISNILMKLQIENRIQAAVISIIQASTFEKMIHVVTHELPEEIEEVEIRPENGSVHLPAVIAEWSIVILFPVAYFRFISNQNIVFPSGNAKIGTKQYPVDVNTSPALIEKVRTAVTDEGGDRRCEKCLRVDGVADGPAAVQRDERGIVGPG